jgi:hypothetical protein
MRKSPLIPLFQRGRLDPRLHGKDKENVRIPVVSGVFKRGETPLYLKRAAGGNR